MRGAARLVPTVLAVLLAVLSVPSSRADIWPPIAGRSDGGGNRDDDDPEKRMRVGVSAGWLFPFAPMPFEYFRPDFGLGFTMIHPVAPVVDIVTELEDYKLRFDRRRFEEDFGATPTHPVSDALVSPLLILARIHRDDEGLRPFGDLGIGLLSVSRPGVFYFDSTGAYRELQGAEIFGLDWCYTLGTGFEWVSLERALGGYVEARAIWAPAIAIRPTSSSRCAAA